jgi:CHASE3 domain sensor protein
LDPRLQYSGEHKDIYVPLDHVLHQKDYEVTFHHQHNNIICKRDDQRIGTIRRFEDQTFIESLLDSNNYYRAYISNFTEDKSNAVITIYQPFEWIKDIQQFYINTSSFGNEKELEETYVFEGKTLFVSYNPSTNKYLLFGERYRVLDLKWNNDQLIVEKERTHLSIKEYGKLIKHALLFETTVHFTTSIEKDSLHYEMRSLSTFFNREFHYLQEWQKYMDYEKELLQNQIKACKPLPYHNRKFIKDGIRFFLDSTADTEGWEQAQSSLIVESRFKRGKNTQTKTLGRIIKLENSAMDIEWNEDDSFESLSVGEKGKLVVNENANDTAMKRRKRAMDNVLQRKSVMKNLREILSDEGYVKEISKYHSHFPSVGVPKLINGFDPDPIQKRAVEAALNTNDICLIQGPPGTGKTSVIQTIMKCLMEQGKDKILLTSFQHLAVDNAMEGLIESGFLTYRYGGTDYEMKTEQEYVKVVEDIMERVQTSLPTSKVEWKASDEQLVKEEILSILQNNRLGDEDIERVEILVQSLNDFGLVHTSVYIVMTEVLMSLSLLKNYPIHNLKSDPVHEAHALLKETPRTLEEISSRTAFKVWEEFVNLVESITNNIGEYHLEVEALRTTYKEIKRQRRRVLLLEKQEETVQRFLKLVEQLVGNSTQLVEELGNHVVEDEEDQAEIVRDLFEQLQILADEIDKALAKSDTGKLTAKQEIQKDWIKQISADPLAFADVVKKYANVKGVTCQQSGAQQHGLYKIIYDVVIVDEAARANPLDLLIPLTMANKVILVGDHKQLPHILEHQFELTYKEEQSEKALQEIFQQSLFERLYTNFPVSKKVMLSKQFRMHPTIGKLVGELFYKSLDHGTTHENLLNDTGLYEGKNIAWLDLPYKSKSNTDGEQEKYQNVSEAKQIIKEVKKLVKDHAHYQIGIITFYSQQATLIKNLVDHHGLKGMVEVGTVDAFQGKEKDVVFLSTVRSNSYPSTRKSLGFLQFPNRLNVAMSRGKRLLVVVGDSTTLRKEANFNKLYEYTKENGYVATVH